MDSFSLKTASTYLNNLLLARGLLHNGKPIEFARPGKADGGAEATMAQIINVVHDLILRRDRELEQRETLVQTIRNLRTEATQSTYATEKLQTRNEDLSRQISLCQSQERASRAALRSAESSARTLREEMLRLKATVQQVRTACANDVRKRDVQIQKLKTHLMAQQRGNKTGLVGASITITPGVTGMGVNQGGYKDDEMPDLGDPEYSLKQETNEFLTQLSQGLSDENDSLISLVRSTLSTLRELQGIPEIQLGDQVLEAGVAPTNDGDVSTGSMVQALPTSCDALASDMDGLLQTLKTLLTNPNFVPIDEVTVREEEIARLRAGFERLEARWREAIALMNGWRERMQNGGDTVNLDELKVGLGLGIGFGASVMIRGAEPAGDDSVGLDDLDLDSASEGELDLVPAVSPHLLKAPVEANRKGSGAADVVSQQQPLKEADGNAVSTKRTTNGRSRDAAPGAADENAAVESIDRSPMKPSSTKGSVKASQPAAAAAVSRLPRKTLKRPHSPERRGNDNGAAPPGLTVQEKLGHAQAEADAAVALAAAVDEASKQAEKLHKTAHAGEETETAREGVKRKRNVQTGRPKRRKSTLTRDQMADLLAGLIA